jgi:hypothetical protein
MAQQLALAAREPLDHVTTEEARNPLAQLNILSSARPFRQPLLEKRGRHREYRVISCR